MEIRSFQKGDTSQIISLWERCNLTVSWNDPEKDIQRKLTTQSELLLVGVQEERIVATVMAGYDGHRGWLYYLAVDPDYQKQGYGSRIVAEAERRLRAMGCPKINLMVRNSNQKVREFYQSLGYQVDEVVSLGKRLVDDTQK
ncbi:MAG: GNAT family acetyltransferase [Desulfobulbaceae bacterium]|nr:MAG: GNAT family acetyltransferase [Desulfobulbaceae bacterium]